MTYIPLVVRDVIITAICYAEDHCASPHVYVEKALKEMRIPYDADHELFVERYLEGKE